MAMNKINNPASIPPRILEQFNRSAPSQEQQKTQQGGPSSPASRPGKTDRPSDKAEISDNARKLEDLRRMLVRGQKALADTPDVRQERLEQVRARLQAGHYDSDEVKQEVASRLDSVLRRLDTLLE